jgi:hypothetical protein
MAKSYTYSSLEGLKVAPIVLLSLHMAVHHAELLTRPQGRWTLTLPEIPAIKTAYHRLGFAT